MTVNKTEQSLPKRLVKIVQDLQSQMRAIKTAQAIGADVVKIETIPAVGVLFGGPLTLAAGAYGSFRVTNIPSHVDLTQWDFLTTLYVDGITTADQFPNGANMTAAKLKASRSDWKDWAESDDSTNTRVVYTRIHNEDSSSHNYYFATKAYLPQIGGGSSS